MQTQGIRPSSARIELGIVIGQQRSERSSIPDWIALKILTIPKCRKLAVRGADFRTFEIIQIEIGQQMEPWLDLDHFDRRAAIVSNERFGARHDQQIERIVIRAALPRCELGRLARSAAPERIEAKQAARSRIGIPAILGPPIQQPRNDSILTNPEPGPAGFEILPADHMRMLEQGSGVRGRPLEKLIAISRNHNRTIAGGLKVDRQGTHRYKIGSHQTPAQPPFPSSLARYFTGEAAGRNAASR